MDHDDECPSLAPHACRSAQEVFDSHLQLARQGRVEDDLALNYAPDCLVLTGEGAARGHDALRRLAARLQDELPARDYAYVTRVCEEDTAFLEWTAEDARTRVRDGADTFVIRSGRIVAQTIHYTVEEKAADAG